ncbi:protein EARLY-RESPONSIVE TO DEHYDRATION 7, chloroplastic-like isoform X2 [Arachis stenosperma]|uniref:protein EARLY-RESPONSIVE TO DEHYDRATION 7, chloroplastic-like isoform X2 n=1 Tax=Arachis stenosperma TaxID=217475 RepID=UPI0025AB9477|nr:protein EARLY-RESPONSIVE TO DEHYDRATION 7, chloroplastic-like isoform X2 [Arachis stenosperma]
MGCCFHGSTTIPPMETSTASVAGQYSSNLRQEVLLQIAECKVHLMDEGQALELAQGHFMITKAFDENVSLATIIKVDDLQWPLTKDEPVVKLDALHYLFSLPVKDAKAIAGGTGQIVKGIFICSNAYTNKVQKGGETILNSHADERNGVVAREKIAAASKKSKINKNLKRVRKLSKMTEKLSKSLLNGVGIVSGSVITPVLKSKTGKKFLKMLPGEVLLASLDALNKVLDAAEAAEKQTFSATSKAASGMVSKRFGEDAGEATEHVLATAGHAANAAWNVFKIRKAINPASSATTGVLKNVAKNTKF